jgi:hypothetical protein
MAALPARPGKTHTIMGILERVAREVAGQSVHVTFYEIHGKKCYDLLRNRQLIRLLADASDTVHVRGARQVRQLSVAFGNGWQVSFSKIK